MEAEKKVCQRLADQVSSLRWDLICPSQLMVLKKRIRLGSSSSWDSRPVISVRSTESSTVATMRCCECRLNCSARREPANMSLRSWKDCQWMSICWVTLSCEGMTVTSCCCVIYCHSKVFMVQATRLCNLICSLGIELNWRVLIATCKQLVWSIRIGRNMPIWVLWPGDQARCGKAAPGMLQDHRYLGVPDPRRAETFASKRRHPGSQNPLL